VTGCGCLLLVGILIGGILFMMFGSTDPGEPIAQMVIAASGLALSRVLLVPCRRGLVRLRSA
jgi:hypothetical protein